MEESLVDLTGRLVLSVVVRTTGTQDMVQGPARGSHQLIEVQGDSDAGEQSNVLDLSDDSHLSVGYPSCCS